MQLQQRINAFVQLGNYLSSFVEPLAPQQQELLYKAKAHNGWFTTENLLFALQSWGEALTLENLTQWTSHYSFSETQSKKTIAIVMAGNIPLVGFHDFISVMISGNKVLAKLSSHDKILLPHLSEKLCEITPKFKESIHFTEGKLENFNAVIATGSNNTARHFQYYFGKYPHIIRKNRNAVAVLTGEESSTQMESLAQDVFQYFGLGCRNVSKIYIPKNYNKDHFFQGMFSWKALINNDKYINNYDYNKAVYLMSSIDLLDNEFMLLKEDNSFSSPISVVFYETYTSLEKVEQHLEKNSAHIQCIIGQCGIKNEIAFGNAQTPKLWDYADGVDTIKFILDLD